MTLLEKVPVVFLDRDEVLRELRQFEERSGWTSQEFFSRWCSGEPALDQPDFFTWAWLCSIATKHGYLPAATPLPIAV